MGAVAEVAEAGVLPAGCARIGVGLEDARVRVAGACRPEVDERPEAQAGGGADRQRILLTTRSSLQIPER